MSIMNFMKKLFNHIVTEFFKHFISVINIPVQKSRVKSQTHFLFNVFSSFGLQNYTFASFAQNIECIETIFHYSKVSSFRRLGIIF